MFLEAALEARTDGAQLRKALEQLAAGDVLMVKRLDRLAQFASVRSGSGSNNQTSIIVLLP